MLRVIIMYATTSMICFISISFVCKVTNKKAKNQIFSSKLLIFHFFDVSLHPLKQNRDVAQLVAHYVRDVGVGRSSRLIPTGKKEGGRDNRPPLLFLLFLRVWQIVTQMGRLVVGRVLPADAETVDVVVHQCGHGIGCRDVCREYVQMRGIA